MSLSQLQEEVMCMNVQYGEICERRSTLTSPQKTLFHGTRRIQFYLADLHVSLEAVKTTTKTSLISQCLYFSTVLVTRHNSHFDFTLFL